MNASRKYRLALLTLLMSSVLLISGNLTSESWAAVVSAVLLAYMGSNVAQKALVKEPTSDPIPPVDAP